MSLFYFPPDGQALVDCAWTNNCPNKQAPNLTLNLCEIHAKLVYRLLDEDRRKNESGTPEEYTADVEPFADIALALGWIYYLAANRSKLATPSTSSAD